MGTIRKDGLCRICLSSKANSSGYCSPCRYEMYRNKPCTTCGKAKKAGTPQCKACILKRYKSIPYCRTCWSRSGTAECSRCANRRRQLKCAICGKMSIGLQMKNKRICVECHDVVKARRLLAKVAYKTCSQCNTPLGDSLNCKSCGKYWHNHGKRWCHDCSSEISSISKWCSSCKKVRKLMRKYGMSRDDVLRIKLSGKCEICTKKLEIVSIDHCHDTGAVRGGLCMACNTALGNFRDSPKILDSAIHYLSAERTFVSLKGTKRTYCECGTVKPAKSTKCLTCRGISSSQKYCNTCLALLDGDRVGKTHFCGVCATRNVKKSQYGLNESELSRLESVTSCEICNENCKLCVDHCHTTGRIRGMICNNCNLGLGQLRDSQGLLLACKSYIEKHKSRL